MESLNIFYTVFIVVAAIFLLLHMYEETSTSVEDKMEELEMRHALGQVPDEDFSLIMRELEKELKKSV